MVVLTGNVKGPPGLISEGEDNTSLFLTYVIVLYLRDPLLFFRLFVRGQWGFLAAVGGAKLVL